MVYWPQHEPDNISTHETDGAIRVNLQALFGIDEYLHMQYVRFLMIHAADEAKIPQNLFIDAVIEGNVTQSGHNERGPHWHLPPGNPQQQSTHDAPLPQLEGAVGPDVSLQHPTQLETIPEGTEPSGSSSTASQPEQVLFRHDDPQLQAALKSAMDEIFADNGISYPTIQILSVPRSRQVLTRTGAGA